MESPKAIAIQECSGFDKALIPCYFRLDGFGAPIAQLDRAPDYESVGRRFKSCWARQ